MFSRIVVILALTSLAALAMLYLGESDDEAVLKRELDEQFDSLREHLLGR